MYKCMYVSFYTNNPMPQEIRVVQCFECKMFQVDIVKKVKKWSCKICGTTQSLKKEYFRGNGMEARCKAQQMNVARGNLEKEKTSIAEQLLDNAEIDWDLVKEQTTVDSQQSFEENCINEPVPIAEKWGTRKGKFYNHNENDGQNKASKWNEFT